MGLGSKTSLCMQPSLLLLADSLEFGPTMCNSHHPTYALHKRQLAANARVLVAHGHVVSTSFEGAGLFSVGV